MIIAQTNWSDGANVVFSIFAIIITIVLIIYLFFRTKKERIDYKNEIAELIEGVAKKVEIQSVISNHINKAVGETNFSLIMLDYDHYQDLVNAFGEANGKKVLEESLKNVRKAFPNRVQIGRMGIDNFLIFVKEDMDHGQIINFANRLKEEASKAVRVYADTSVNPTVSMGVVFFPQHGKNLKQLLKSLDLSIYEAKSNGGDKVCIYSEDMYKEDADNLQLYYEIKEAIKNKEFVLYYQPIINVLDNSIYGFEALLRWQHPTLGILTPGSFINILEQSGDINVVGVWGIETLIKEYIELKKQFVYKNLQLSFNLSPRQLLSDTLAVSFQRILKKYRVPASNITIEIVEFAMFERHEMVLQNIKNLKELGFKIAVDGVGLDQNTLSRLGDSLIDIIKLDRSFMFDDENSYLQQKYIELLIDFSKRSNKVVICEGVEDITSINKVKNFGIDLVQGYFFSKPISQIELFDYIQNESKIEEQYNIEVEKEEIRQKEELEAQQSKEVVNEKEEKIPEKQNKEKLIKAKKTITKKEKTLTSNNKEDVAKTLSEEEVTAENE